MIKINLAIKRNRYVFATLQGYGMYNIHATLDAGVPHWVVVMCLAPIILCMVLLSVLANVVLLCLRYLHVLLCTVVLVGAAWMFYMYMQVV